MMASMSFIHMTRSPTPRSTNAATITARRRRAAFASVLVAALALVAAGDAAGEDAGSWPFAPAVDAFTADALLDLRPLNEAAAGMHGPVRRSADGAGFVRGDGAPLRFWGVLIRIDEKDWDEATLTYHYRLLAKRGVNLVRLFGQICVQADGATLDAVDEQQIARFHAHVAAAKAAGIYAMIAPYWCRGAIPASWGIEGADPAGLIFASARFRAAYLGWMRALLTRANPHLDGVALKDEPAVAVIQVHNEDSLLWYTSQGLAEPHQRELRRAYGAWLKERYGSISAAIAAWDGVTIEHDDDVGGEAGMYIVWYLSQPAGGGMAKRLADQLAFTAGFQRQVYADIVAVLRGELDCTQLINACNWHTVDEALVGDAERWTYTAADVVALNRYTTGVHRGPNVGWRIDPGDEIGHVSALRHPETMPFGVRQPVGHPFVLTENAWVFPNRFIAEGPFVMAAFASLAGVDGAVWSMVCSPAWENGIALPWMRGQPNAPLIKWMIDTPSCLGGFPAHALAFRRGDIATPAAAAHQPRRAEDLWQRVPSVPVEGRPFDPNVDAGDPTTRSTPDARAFLLGPVTVSFDGSGDAIPADRHADRIVGDRVASLGGEIETDTRVGVCRVQAARFQGVCGFLREGGGSFALRDVVIACRNEFAAVSVVALDDAPLAKAESVLVQVGTEAWPTGWRTEATAEAGIERVAATGDGPWRITAAAVEISVRNPRLRLATALDVNGYAVADLPVRREGGSLVVTLPPDALYVVLRSSAR